MDVMNEDYRYGFIAGLSVPTVILKQNIINEDGVVTFLRYPIISKEIRDVEVIIL